MITATNISKIYHKEGSLNSGHSQTVAALSDISLTLEQGDFTVLHGASGSGKSTLLLILGAMLSPSSGKVIFHGEDLYSVSAARRNRFRKNSIGFIFQKFYLLPYLTAYDNIRLALARQRKIDNVKDTIHALAKRLHIEHRLNHVPRELSAGEQQRVALARTIVVAPELILADEPSGNLDEKNRDIIAECLVEESQRGSCVVLATHDTALKSVGKHLLLLDQGRIAHDVSAVDDPH